CHGIKTLLQKRTAPEGAVHNQVKCIDTSTRRADQQERLNACVSRDGQCARYRSWSRRTEENHIDRQRLALIQSYNRRHGGTGNELAASRTALRNRLDVQWRGAVVHELNNLG